MTRLSYRQILIGEQMVGLLGLDELLAALYAGGAVPEPALGPRLLEGVEGDNYVFPRARPLYEEALLREYRRYWRQQQAGGEAPARRPSPGTWQGRPREQVPWYPTVYPERCDGCGECLRFCPNGVFELDGESDRAIVVDPFHCVVGCDACTRICKRGAIRFPPREMLARLHRR
jgi:NAD-dependent dihydropyrimidine dehydrogenase PreA subunit